MDSYCAIKFGPSSDTSSASLRDLSDSSRSSVSLACSPRMPVDSELSFRSWERHLSRPGDNGCLGAAAGNVVLFAEDHAVAHSCLLVTSFSVRRASTAVDHLSKSLESPLASRASKAQRKILRMV